MRFTVLPSPIELLEARITPAGNLLAQVTGGHLIITGDALANSLEIIEADSGSSNMVSYLLRALDEDTTINGSSEPVTLTGVTGDVRISLGDGSDLLRVGKTGEGSFRTIRDLRINGGDGDNTIEFKSNGSFVVGRHVTITNGAGNDYFEASAGTANGNMIITNGSGSSTTRLGEGFGTGSVRIGNGTGEEVIAEVEATINGYLSINAPKASSVRISIGVTDVLNETFPQIAGNLQIITGPGSDQVTITNIDNLHRGSINTGGSGDLITIDDTKFARGLSLSSGAGADRVKIDTREGSGSATLLNGRVNMDLGTGDDLLQLGSSGSALSRVEILGKSRWDGGAGKDRLDSSNVSASSSEPAFVRFDYFGASPLLKEPVFFDVGSYDAGTYLVDMVSADLDGDGNLDLIAVDNEIGTVNILLGNGDGSFEPEIVLEAGTRPMGLAVADLDGFNGLDLVVATQDERKISVFLNDGSGSFGARSAFGVGRDVPPIDVMVADFNKDGAPDLATLNISDYQAASVSVLLGTGNGSFTFLMEFELTGPDIDYFGAPNDIALGDIDGNGNVDLAVTGLRGFGVLLGNGDGTFQVRVEERAVASGLELADMNGDGKLDLLVQGGKLELQLGKGDGTFLPPVVLSAAVTGDPSVADFNNDGNLDIAVTRFGIRTDLLQVILGRGDATFDLPRDFEIGGESGPVAIGDFDNDGFLDVAVANSYAARIAVLLNRGAA